MDELFEVLTLVQCRKQETPIRVILYGRDFWEGLILWLNAVMNERYQTISAKDLFIFDVVDTVEEAASIIAQLPVEETNLVPVLT